MWYYLVIVILSTITLVSSIGIVLKKYVTYHIPSHLLMGIAFCFLEIAVLIFCISGLMLDPQDITSQWILRTRQWGNACIVLGYLFVFYGFLHYRTSGISYMSNLISVLGGMLIICFFYPGSIQLTYDPGLNRIKGEFSLPISLMIFPFLLVIIFYWIRPLIHYLRQDQSRKMKKSIQLQLIGFSILILWIGSTFITHIAFIGAIRGLIAYLPWIFWTLSIQVNPLILCHSRTDANWLMVLHKSGIPLYFYSFTHQQPKNLEMASGIITTIDKALHNVMSSQTSLASVNYKDKKLLFYHSEDHTILLNCNSTDKILMIALHLFSEVFETQFQEEVQANFHQVSQFREANALIHEIFSPLLNIRLQPTS